MRKKTVYDNDRIRQLNRDRVRRCGRLQLSDQLANGTVVIVRWLTLPGLLRPGLLTIRLRVMLKQADTAAIMRVRMSGVS